MNGDPVEDKQHAFNGAVFSAVGFALWGVLSLVFRPNWRVVGTFLVAAGAIHALDAVLVRRGVPAGKRLRLRIALGSATLGAVGLLWYLGIQ